MNSNWSPGDNTLIGIWVKISYITEEIRNDFNLRTWESFVETMKFELGFKE